MSFIQFLVNLVAAIPVLDKWLTNFNKLMHDHKTKELEQKARAGELEDLQKHAGEDS